MKNVIFILALALLSGCAAQKPMTKAELNACVTDCAVQRASCSFGTKYCNARRAECEEKCQ